VEIGEIQKKVDEKTNNLSKSPLKGSPLKARATIASPLSQEN
jgi:hypothetical protein